MKHGITLFFLCCISCARMENPIGDYPVYLRLDLSTTDKALREGTAPSSKAYTTKNININIDRVGFGGVLVVRAIVDDALHAFDLACPHEALRNVLIQADADHLNAVCPQCGTKYEVGIEGSGAPNGIGKHYLKKYTVTGSGTRFTVIN